MTLFDPGLGKPTLTKAVIWWTAVPLVAAVLGAAALTLLWVAVVWPVALVALIFIVVFGLILVRREAARTRERNRLSWDADVQHAAMLSGDTRLGMYGRWPPAEGFRP